MKLTLKSLHIECFSFWVSRCLSEGGDFEGAVCAMERMFQIAELFLRKGRSYCITATVFAGRGSFSVPSFSDNFRIFCFYYDVDLTCAVAQIWLSVYFQIPILRPTFLTLNPSCRVQGIFTKLSTVC